MGKSSAKKRKREERKASDGTHRWNRLLDADEKERSSTPQGSVHEDPASDAAQRRKVTTSPHTDDSVDTSESKKRSRRRLGFVYPRKKGIAQPYQFNGKRKKPGSDEGTFDKQMQQLTQGKDLARDVGVSRETLDDILAGASKRKRSGESPPRRKGHDDEASSQSPPTPADAKVEGKLSGMSVEDAVRDKSGCRPRANSTDGELNLPRRGLCDEHMVLQAHKWNDALHAIPKGFVNLGNTCFLNSTLQCLAFLPPFCQSLLAMPARESNGSKASQGKRITMLLRAFFHKVHGSQHGGTIAPTSVVKTLPSLGTVGSRGYKFRPGRQEDAHEFLVHLLDAMHDGELREAGINQRASGWRDRLPVPRLDETTFIHRVFGGYLRSQLRCSKCGYCSNTYDPFLDLALEVSKKSINTVAAAFQEFTRKETLDSDNRWKCGGCHKHVRAIKALTVFRPPLSLCVQMKRFTFGGSGFYSGYSKNSFGRGGNKVTKPIAFPAEMSLPLSDGRSCPYALTGVVIHVGGSSHSGHYTAYVKKPSSKGFQWYHMDDSFVEAVSEKTVLQERDAYLLFYCRTEVKLEFPAPPRRGSMTAAEATEHGRARARARADSLTKLEMEKDAASAVGQKAPPASGTELSKASSHREKDALIGKKGKTDNPRKDASLSQSKNSKDKPAEAAVSKKIQADESKGMAMATSEATPVAKNPTPKSSDTSSDSSSDDSSDDDSSSSSEASEASPYSGAKAKSKERETRQSEATGKLSKGSPPAEGTQQPEGALKETERSVTKANDPIVGNSQGAESLPTSSSKKNKATASLSDPKDTTHSASKKKSPKHNNGITRIVLDRGKGRERVSVMMGRSVNKRWIPQTLARTKSGQGYQLLGNRTVGKWDDNADETEPSAESELSKARTHIVDGMEKKKNARKRKTYLDRWDASLDRGRTKKVKEKREVDTSDKPNSFQRILSGLQRMKHGRPKGHQGNTSSSKKRKKR